MDAIITRGLVTDISPSTTPKPTQRSPSNTATSSPSSRATSSSAAPRTQMFMGMYGFSNSAQHVVKCVGTSSVTVNVTGTTSGEVAALLVITISAT